MKYRVTIEDRVFQVQVTDDGVLLDGEPVEVDFASGGAPGLYTLLLNHESFECLVERREGTHRVLFKGNLYEAEVLDERDVLLGGRATELAVDSSELPVKAPMPGLVVAIPVYVGQHVEKGQAVIILESMKMENELKAPRAGVIQDVLVDLRQSVEQGQVMLIIGPAVD